MDIIKSVIDIVKDVGPIVQKYLKYQICHNDYVNEFKEIQENLKRRRNVIDANLKTQQKQPGKIPNDEVDAWLKKANEEISRIMAENLISKGGCFTYICSSRHLDKNTQALNGIFRQGEKYTSASESLVIDDHSIKGVPLLVEKCNGRDDTKDQILKWLKGDKITRIAVWGMGGVGKTTIMKLVHNQLLKEPKFKKVIWVKVSKDFDIIVEQKKEFDILRFQKRIASSLGLKLEPEDHENEIKLAGLISQTLGQGSYVLIMDDVWQPFSLEDVGIPDLDGNNGCKIVLTTRVLDVACAMNCKVIKVKPLSQNEALTLFLDNVGRAMLSDGRYKREIEPNLMQILQKCGGLPLAIMTVAKTMKGKLDPHSWKWALSKLRCFERIVDRLKFSYECLEPQYQECFLYCALYPEDYEIPKKELIEYWIEEEFTYQEGETRDVMNCEGHVILEKLLDNCLLELVQQPKGREDCVSMHDLHREMALEIKPQFLVKAGMALEKLPEEHEWREDLLKVSLMSNYITEIPSSMPPPKCRLLTTLLLSNNEISTIPEAFFKYMLVLKILDLSNNRELSRLPSSISELKKLTTLLLEGCLSLTEIPSLSNLTGLKKLDLWGTSLEKLPQGLNMLSNMKYLRLGGRLSEIPDGLLQNLSKLQHLGVDWSIPLNAKEIGRLRKLEFLYGQFSRVHDLNIFFTSGGKFLSMYDFIVGSFNEEDYLNFSIATELKSILCSRIDICGELNWLPSNVQKFDICRCKNVRSLNDISGFQDATDLRVVCIRDCDDIEFVLSWPWLNLLQNLEKLYLIDLNRLNAVFGEEGTVAKSGLLQANTFYNLKEIIFWRCDKIKKLFPLKWLEYFQNLQIIEIKGCLQMEEIIWSEYEGEETLQKVTLPKLEKLELTDLPQLKSIYNGSTTVLHCNTIKIIQIWNCRNIKSVFWSGFNPLPTLDCLELWQLQNLKFVFDEEALGLSPALPPTHFFSPKTIRVIQCNQLKTVFSSGWLLGYFHFLESIEVGYCEQMEELILSSTDKEEKVIVPKLQKLELMDMPALKSICSNSSVLICDSIQRLKIVSCKNLKRIPLNFGLLNNAQSSHASSFKRIWVDTKERWESLEWDYPNAKAILLPFCKFLFEYDDSEDDSEENKEEEL